MATQLGTVGNDALFGDDFDNFIDALEGDDSISGYAGADTLWGGIGNDTLWGDEGKDILYGGDGVDYLYGGYGEDKLYGGAGNDYLYGHEDNNYLDGGDGNDILYGGLMNDEILGGNGDDKIYAYNGNDILNGGAGNDELYGYEGDDTINGGDGDDTILGAAGNDTLYGGLGQDLFYFSDQNFGNDVIFETNEADNSNSPKYTVEFYGGAVADYGYTKINNDLIIQHVSGNGSVRISDYFLHNIQAVSAPIFDYRDGKYSSFIVGGAGIDNLTGTSIADVMHGNAGADTIDSGDGDDVVFGGLGNDVIDGGTGYDKLYGQEGNDTIRGNYGADIIVGGKGNDTMYSGDGSDEDTYRFYSGDGVDMVIDLDDRFLRGDFLEFLQVNSSQAIFTKQGDDLVVAGYGLTTDKVIVKQYFDTSTFARNKRFTFKDKTLLAGDVKLSVKGTLNGDVLKGSEYADLIQGLDGNDILYGYLGNDALQGGKGNDTLFGNEGADGLNGNEGNDVLNAGKGNDVIYGGVSNDADTYIFYLGDGSDTVIDTDDSSAKDTLRFINMNASNAQYLRKGTDLVISAYGSSGDAVKISQYFDRTVAAHNKQFQFADKTMGLLEMQAGSLRFNLNGSAEVDTLNGSQVADTIYGLAGNDKLYGYEGSDLLRGGIGNDTLFGGVGADALNGDAGIDVLNGGTGNDTLYGGAGNDADSYIFYKGDGTDTVIDTDDTSALDTLRFININSSAATFSKVGTDLLISGYGVASDKVTVKQFFTTTVNAANKQFQFADKTVTANQVSQLIGAMNAMATTTSVVSNTSVANSMTPNLAVSI